MTFCMIRTALYLMNALWIFFAEPSGISKRLFWPSTGPGSPVCILNVVIIVPVPVVEKSETLQILDIDRVCFCQGISVTIGHCWYRVNSTSW